MPLVLNTLLVMIAAISLAAPIAIAAATSVSEFSTPRFRRRFGQLMDLLQGIPPIAIGFVALFVFTPMTARLFSAARTRSLVVASIAVALMILPTIVRFSTSVLSTIPQSMRESAYAVGSSRFHVTWRVTLPAAAGGILASILLASAQAMGETMIVAIAAGIWTPSGVEALNTFQTLTTGILQSALSNNAAAHQSLFVLSLALFVCTYLVNATAQGILHRIANRHRGIYR